MRLAIMISFVVAGLIGPAQADDALQKVAAWTHVGYILSEEQAEAQKKQLIESVPGIVHVDGFWTPTEQDVAVADRALCDLITLGVKNPVMVLQGLDKKLDPDKPDSIPYEGRELQSVLDNYDDYQRQYFGFVIDGVRVVFCNYAHGPKFDASAGYLYMEKVFVPGGSVQFLQCRFDPIRKTCSNVSLIGTWQEVLK